MSTFDSKILSQHQLVESVFCASGGKSVEALLPRNYIGKRADVVFDDSNVIAEVKSLTSDRKNDPSVSKKLGQVLENGTAFGAPIVFGTTSINVNQLPRTVAERVVRVIGARARKEVISAAEQIEQTRSVLGMSDAYGLLTFIAPAHVFGQQTLRWLIHDLLQRRGDFAGLDGAMLIQTSLCFGGGASGFGDTFSSLWSISGRPFPEGLADNISKAWGSITGQACQPGDFDEFTRKGMIE